MAATAAPKFYSVIIWGDTLGSTCTEFDTWDEAWDHYLPLKRDARRARRLTGVVTIQVIVEATDAEACRARVEDLINEHQAKGFLPGKESK